MASTKLKTLCLLDVLAEKTDEAHRMSAPELVSALAERGIYVERKGIYKDLEALVEHGEDVIKTPTGYYLGKRTFELPELRLLISAVQAAYFISPERSEDLVKKLASMVSIHKAKELLLQANVGGVKCENDEVMDNIDLLNLAISERRQVTFFYYKKDSARRLVAQRGGRRYRVSPYALIWMQDRYYLVCNMDGRDNLTHFRLDRIRNLRVEVSMWRHFSQVSRYKTKFDSADYAKKSINMFGDTVRLVTLNCDNSIASDIFDKFGEDMHISRGGAGRFRAIFEVSAGPGFISWVAQWGDKIEIISPKDVRDDMKEHLKNSIAQYDKPDEPQQYVPQG